VVPSDIIVVGAGVIGCSVAYELARRGASVQVVDNRGAGRGATQASAGMLAPFIEAAEGSPLLDLAVRSLDLYDAFVDEVRAASGLTFPYQRTGTLEVGVQEKAFDRLQAAAVVVRSRNMAAELLDAQAVRQHEPALTPAVRGGLFIPWHGYVAAGELTRALTVSARRHGAQIIEHSRVHRIRRAGPDIGVDTDRGSLTANAAVLAAGSWTGQVEIEGAALRLPIRPVRGQLLHLEGQGPPLRRVTWGERCYLVPWEDRTLLVGATVEDAGFDERTTVAGVHDLIEAASELVPQIRSATFHAPRVGLRPACDDLLPAIGRSLCIPKLVFATGHYRSGVLLAPVTAKLVGDILIDNREDPLLDRFRPERFGVL
jgi:glycine oxidase